MATATAPVKPPVDLRSWVARHKALTAIGVIFILLAVGFYFLGWPLVKWKFDSQFRAAVREVQQSPKVIEKLGEPIEVARFLPGVVAEENNITYRFPVAGPKGRAEVTATARYFDNAWAFNQLEVTYADAALDKDNLARDIQQRDGTDDMPRFDPNAKPTEVKLDLPVDIALPDLPAAPGQ